MEAVDVSGRTVVLASADAGLRQRLRELLTGLRWRVREAGGGAEALAYMEECCPEALLMDSWLPDLEVTEFARQIGKLYPGIELVRVDGIAEGEPIRSPRRNELLHALRQAQQAPIDPKAVQAASPRSVPQYGDGLPTPINRVWPGKAMRSDRQRDGFERAAGGGAAVTVLEDPTVIHREAFSPVSMQKTPMTLPELVGTSHVMQELAALIRMVSPRSTTVLIEGETGTGKEVVARAIHRLSARAERPFGVLNCAAIPEALLEAELFGHTRGAFTGAVQSRTGRIEAADGGTLFLDEIGEMPLMLQAKMLRFLECGELQRVGDNGTMHVDVRVIAATHQLLEEKALEKSFRLDLYHRLAVFPIEVSALRERLEDIPLLAEHFLMQLGRTMPKKRLSRAALLKLQEHSWPGNVRELMHVLERGAILCGERQEIDTEEIRFRRTAREESKSTRVT